MKIERVVQMSLVSGGNDTERKTGSDSVSTGQDFTWNFTSRLLNAVHIDSVRERNPVIPNRIIEKNRRSSSRLVW